MLSVVFNILAERCSGDQYSVIERCFFKSIFGYRNQAYNVYYNAPCLVIIGGPAEARNLVPDCSLAACYFMLAAAARKLGTGPA